MKTKLPLEVYGLTIVNCIFATTAAYSWTKNYVAITVVSGVLAYGSFLLANWLSWSQGRKAK